MVRTFRTEDASPEELTTIYQLMLAAFEHDFSRHDWQHAIGGTHFLIEQDERPIAHASVVVRPVSVGDFRVDSGYVEAVATHPELQRRGFGTTVMGAVGDFIREHSPLGVLDTGENAFYERFGWETWDGPTGVRTEDGWDRTPHEDGNVMILRTRSTPKLQAGTPIVTNWRAGDVW